MLAHPPPLNTPDEIAVDFTECPRCGGSRFRETPSASTLRQLMCCRCRTVYRVLAWPGLPPTLVDEVP